MSCAISKNVATYVQFFVTNLSQILSQIVKRFDVPQLAILYSLDCPSQNIFDGPDVEGVDDREEGEEPFEDVEDVGDAEDK